MKNLSRLGSVGMLLLVMAINSCQKATPDLTPKVSNGQSRVSSNISMSSELEDLSVKGDVEVRNGILHFKNLASFFDVEDKLRASSNEEQRDILLKSPSFVSLSKSIYNAYGPLRDSLNSTSPEEILNSNNDILQRKEGRIIPKGALSHKDVVTRQGLVFIGKVLYRFTEDKEIIVSDGDVAKALLGDQASFKNSKVLVFNTTLSSKTNSPNGRVTASPCSSMSGTRWNSDGKRAISYIVQAQYDAFHTSGSIGTPSARFYVRHQIHSGGNPYKVSPAFSYNFSSYNTDNHFFASYKAHYSSAFTQYAVWDYTISSSSEISNYDSSINFDYVLAGLSDQTETNAQALNQSATVTLEGGIDAFGSNSSQYGYYYSTGVPPPIYMKCQ